MRTANAAAPFAANRGIKKGLIYNELPRCDLAVTPRWSRGKSELPYERLASPRRIVRKLETYPRQSPSIKSRRDSRWNSPSLPCCVTPRRAIYRPYLWHSGTLTVPAIPLYAAVNGAKCDTRARSIRSIYSTCVIRSCRSQRSTQRVRKKEAQFPDNVKTLFFENPTRKMKNPRFRTSEQVAIITNKRENLFLHIT